jgi:hypothetical protein
MLSAALRMCPAQAPQHGCCRPQLSVAHPCSCRSTAADIVPLYMLACCPCVPLPLCTTVPVQAPEHSCHSQWPGGAHPNAAAGAQGQAHNCPRPGRDTPVHIPDRGLCWWGRHTAVGPSQPPRHKQPQQQRRRWLVLVFVIRQNQQRWRQRRQQKQQR